MKLLQLLLVLYFISQISTQIFKENTYIKTNVFLQETESKWLDEINQEVPFFAFFYLPTCRHCKKIIPELENFADFLQQSQTNIIGVDCDIKNDFCGLFKVKNYPTIIYVKDIDEIYTYTSSMKKNLAFQNFIKEGYKKSDKLTYEELESKYFLKPQQRPQYKTSFDPEAKIKPIINENYENFEKSQFVLFYKVSCQHCRTFMPVFEEVSKEFTSEKLQFRAVNCDTHQYICDTFKIKGVPNMLYFKDGYVIGYGEQRSYENIKEYLLGGYKKVEHTKISIKKYIQDTHPVPDDVRVILTNYEGQNAKFIKFFDSENPKAMKIVGMIAFIILLIFFCILKDCASRSTRKPQKPQKQLKPQKLD